jgi:FHS family L-fucose permease-like MFS transporter
MAKNKYFFPFIMVTSLFFMWGFVHNLDPILIPHLKKSFSLNILQSSLVDSAVFIAYLLVAIPAGILMKKYGYKSGILSGLVLFAIGSFLFIPAANTQQYSFFLGALFIISCGLTILETAANPYVSLLGDPVTATSRLNFAQSFNGLAATMAPIIGARFILTEGYSDEELSAMTESARQIALASEASTVKVPYFILGSLILVIATIFYFLRLPEVEDKDESKSLNVFRALRHRHLKWAVVAQFFYVGAQVCVFSFFILYAVEVADIDNVLAADYLGWGCGLAFMVGRFFGVFMMRFIASERLLAIYSTICILLCLIATFSHGFIAIYSVIGITFFMSIMFPTIFSLGIKGLGNDTQYGSSLIVMAIFGGAVLPLLFGYISDLSGKVQYGQIVSLLCFCVILAFAVKGYKVLKPLTKNYA